MYDVPLNGGVVQLRDCSKLSEDSKKKPDQDWLDKVIEAEIIPRLLLAHQEIPTEKLEMKSSALRVEDVSEFARIILKEDETVSDAFVQKLIANGVSLDRIFLELFSPTARLLGDFWLADTANFFDVTLALSRLQQLLRQLCPQNDQPGHDGGARPKILLATVPGEQHTFGIYLLEEFFRRYGWNVRTCTMESEEELRAKFRADQYQIVGFSLSRDELLDQLESGIHKIRMDTTDVPTRVIVGGKSFLENAELARQIGADAKADDALEALSVAGSLLPTRVDSTFLERDRGLER